MKRTGRQFVGTSAAILSMRDESAGAAQSDAKVLILGESGVGKEMVAEAIHAQSRRASGPFIAVNCAGIPEALLEAELLGQAGADFAGAVRTQAGQLAAGWRRDPLH